MKKTSILLTIDLVLVAILAGCNNEVVYPEFLTGGYIKQTGDFVEGEAFDSSKFQVVATYLSGDSRKMDAAVTFVDADKTNTVTEFDKVTADLGYDYYGKELKPELTVTVYPIDHYVVEVKEGATFSSDVTTLDATDFAVYAVYYNGKGVETKKQMPSSEFSFTLGAANEAEETATAPVTVKKGEEEITMPSLSVPVTVVTEEEMICSSISGAVQSSYVVPKLNYETLPEIDPSKLLITFKDGEGTTQTSKPGDFLDGFTYEFVNSETERPLSKEWGEYDFTTFDDVAIKVSYGDVKPFVTEKLTMTDVKINLQYVDTTPTLKAGTVLNSADIVASDFRADLVATNGTPAGTLQVIDMDEVELSYAESVEGKAVYTSTDYNALTDKTNAVSADEVTVTATWLGATGTVEFTVDSVESVKPEIESVTFTVADTYKAPAKQYYDNGKTIAAPVADDIENFTVTMNVGEPGANEAKDKFTFALYTAEGEEVPATTSGEYADLADIDTVLVGAYLTANASAEDKVIYYSDPVKLATPEITILEAEQPAEVGMVGDSLKVTIVASNDNGDVDKDFDGYSVDLNGKPFSGNLSALTYGETDVKYTVWLTSDPSVVVADGVTVKAGKGYYELADGVTAATILAKKADAPEFTLVDAKLIESFNALYEISATAFKTVGTPAKAGEESADTNAPRIVAYSVPADRTVDEGNNELTVTIEYLGKSGEIEETTATVTIVGSAYVADDATFSLTYEGKTISELVSGQPYDVTKFAVVADAEHTHGNPKFEITKVQTTWTIPVTGTFSCISFVGLKRSTTVAESP